MFFNREGAISTLNGAPLILVDKLTYIGSSVSSTESYVNIRLAKVWSVLNRLSYKIDLSNKTSNGCVSGWVSATLSMHLMDADKSHWEKKIGKIEYQIDLLVFAILETI